MPPKVARTGGGSKPTQTKTMAKASSSSKSSGSSKTSSSSGVKKSPPPAKPKNVDKVDFGKPKPTASAGTYKPAPPKPSAHSSASKTFTATHSKPFTAPQPETVTFKVTSSYNEGTTMQFVGQGNKVHFSAPPKDAVKECFKMLHSSDAVERNRIKTQAQMVLLPNAISQANKAYDNLCKAADEYFQVATEIVDKTQDVPERLEGKTTREKVSTTGRTALGVGLEAVVELIHGGSVTPEGIIIGAALGKFARDVERAIEVCVDFVECTEALERVTKNLNKSAEQFNKKNREVFDAIEEAGGKMDGQTIEYPLKSEQIARMFHIQIYG